MISVIAKKTLQFRNPDNAEETVKVQPMVFTTIPDWVTTDPMYEWAKASGTLQVAAGEPEKAAAKPAAAGKDKAAK